MATLQELRHQSVRERFDSKWIPEPNSGCWLWTAAHLSAGYGQFRGMLAHRFSYKEHNGPIPSGLCVLHRCDNPACVNPEHLFVGTHRDNNWDKVFKGRARGNAGTGNHLAKLDADKADWARKAVEYGMPMGVVAEVFGVATSTIKKIVDGITWKKP